MVVLHTLQVASDKVVLHTLQVAAMEEEHPMDLPNHSNVGEVGANQDEASPA